ncbi:hypothetical protein [Alkaliphilus crotonatoxidans]
MILTTAETIERGRIPQGIPRLSTSLLTGILSELYKNSIYNCKEL